MFLVSDKDKALSTQLTGFLGQTRTKHCPQRGQISGVRPGQPRGFKGTPYSMSTERSEGSWWYFAGQNTQCMVPGSRRDVFYDSTYFADGSCVPQIFFLQKMYNSQLTDKRVNPKALIPEQAQSIFSSISSTLFFLLHTSICNQYRQWF